MQLKNKVAWMNGGARMGAVVAEELARRGCDLLLSYRSSKKKALQTKIKAERFGVQAHIIQADITKVAHVKRVVRFIESRFKRLDILINMASIYEPTPITKLTEKVWQRIVDANLKSAYLSCYHSLPLLKRKEGRIINFSDWTAASGRPHFRAYLPYYTAKRGVIGLTESLALECAPRVLVNAIAPGPILLPVNSSRNTINKVLKMTPLNKTGGSQEIVKAVLFLIETDFVTGECIRVDGGRHLY